jgi:hypothetical protein
MMRRLAMVVMIASGVWAQARVKVMGRVVTVTKPKLDDSGMFPEGPATVCVAGPRLCYTAPEKFGRDPEVSIVQVDKKTDAIFFAAKSGGVSGFQVHFALLRPGTGKELENLFLSDPSVSNQSQAAWWTDLSISTAKIFVTVDFVWGPGESHYEDHRYTISAYVFRSGQPLLDDNSYYLEDRYMTARKYASETNAKILDSEKPEILARLRRVKHQSPR